ncbi:hypothetical protein GW17_00013961 [Ensete ventricosum]|nr:hypothetical protein GW17_00013961 [Ensete ventricosum]
MKKRQKKKEKKRRKIHRALLFTSSPVRFVARGLPARFVASERRIADRRLLARGEGLRRRAWIAVEGAVGLGMAGRGATLVLRTSSAVRALAPPVYPAGYLRRVGHVGGPAVRGCDDLAARSAFVISLSMQSVDVNVVIERPFVALSLRQRRSSFVSTPTHMQSDKRAAEHLRQYRQRYRVEPFLSLGNWTKRLVDGSAAGGAAAGSEGEKAEMENSRRNPDSDAGTAVARGGEETAEMAKSRRNPTLAAAISLTLSVPRSSS